MRTLGLPGALVMMSALLVIPGAVAAQTKATGRFQVQVAQHDGYAYAAFRVDVTGGKLAINLTSSVDTYLLVRSPDGSIQGDDDGGDGSNSRISVDDAAAGQWTVIATTYEQGLEGDFSISLDGATSITALPPADLGADMLAAAFATRERDTDRVSAAERARSAALLREQLSLSEFRAQLMEKLRVALAQLPIPDEADRKEFEQLEVRERDLNTALASVASLPSRQLLEQLVRDELTETQRALSSVSSRLNGRVTAREAYTIAIAELEQLTQAAIEMNRLQSLILSAETTPDQLPGLRSQFATAQEVVNALIESLVVKLLDSRFVRELTFAFVEPIERFADFRPAILGAILGRSSPVAGTLGAVAGRPVAGVRSSPPQDPSVWLPALFPWPPPESSSRVVLGRDDFVRSGRPVETLADIDDALTSALKRTGYSGYSYWGVRDGFALVTPIEQTNAEGAPLDGVARWSTQIAEMKEFTLAEYVRALLTAPAGYFRVIVFVITPHSFTSRADRALFSVVERWSRAGHAFLPSGVRRLAFTADHQVTALVYEFRKTTSADKPATAIPGRHTANTHLVRTGVLPEFR
jgi:hypothetical protein